MLAACSPRKSSEPSRGPSGEGAPCSLLHPLSTESVPRSYGRREEVMVPPVPHTALFLPSFRRFSGTKISLFTVCPDGYIMVVVVLFIIFTSCAFFLASQSTELLKPPFLIGL